MPTNFPHTKQPGVAPPHSRVERQSLPMRHMRKGVQHEKKSHHARQKSQQRTAVRVSRLREVVQTQILSGAASDEDPPAHKVRGLAEEEPRRRQPNTKECRESDRSHHAEQTKTKSAKESR